MDFFMTLGKLKRGSQQKGVLLSEATLFSSFLKQCLDGLKKEIGFQNTKHIIIMSSPPKDQQYNANAILHMTDHFLELVTTKPKKTYTFTFNTNQLNVNKRPANEFFFSEFRNHTFKLFEDLNNGNSQLFLNKKAPC